MPVIAFNNEALAGVDLGPVANLLGLNYDSTPELSPKELTQRLQAFLSWLDRSVACIPLSLHTITIPGRDRTIWELIEHMYEIARVFELIADGQRTFSATHALAEPKEAKEATQIQAELRSLITTISRIKVDYDRKIDTYFGDASLHYVLERTTWHIAQHIRQLIDLTKNHSNCFLPSLNEQLFEQLPMPREVWD